MNPRHMPLPSLLASVLVYALSAPPALAEQDRDAHVREVRSQHHALRVERIAADVEHPWAIALLPDGRYLVTERNSGTLRLGDERGTLVQVDGVPEIFRYEGDTPRSQAGLFDVKLDPDFRTNRQVYLSYSKPTERGAALAIARGQLELGEGQARLANVEDFWVMQEDDQDSSGLHFGGRMAFDPRNGHLYLTIGERRNISRSQDRDDQAGSIVRIDRDGNAVAGNPFANGEEGNEYVFSIGHRNPQGIAFAPDGQLWINDHGPKGGDEFNRVQAGQNYGWPFTTAGVDYSGAPIGMGERADGFVPPAHVFEGTVAPSGLAFYDGEQFPRWRGHALNGGLRAQGIVRLRLDGDQVVEAETIELGRRIRDVQVADDGAIWVVTEHEDGEVMRLTAVDEDPRRIVGADHD